VLDLRLDSRLERRLDADPQIAHEGDWRRRSCSYCQSALPREGF
jgi:hypothetical protein